MGLRVERVDDPNELAELRDPWNALAAGTERAQFFQTYDWFASYWRHYGNDQQLHLLLVRDEQKLIGIVPLVIRTERRQVGRLNVLTYPLDDWGSFYHPVSTDNQRTITAAVDYLRQNQKRWEILSWRWCDPHQAATISTAMNDAGMRTFGSVRETSALIDLPSDWDAYLSSRGSKFRNNVKRWTRRVNELGTLRYEKYRPTASDNTSPRWDLYDSCEALAAKSWQGSSESGTTLSHQDIRPFLRNVHEVAAKAGGLDLNLLYLNEHPVAFEYGYWYCGYKYSLRFGYDDKLCKAGVGNLMWLETIKASIERGDHTFDMGPGSLDYKKYFLTHICDCKTLDHYRSGASKASDRAEKPMVLVAVLHRQHSGKLLRKTTNQVHSSWLLSLPCTCRSLGNCPRRQETG